MGFFKTRVFVFAPSALGLLEPLEPLELLGALTEDFTVRVGAIAKCVTWVVLLCWVGT